MAHETHDVSDPSCYVCNALEQHQHRFNPGGAASMNTRVNDWVNYLLAVSFSHEKSLCMGWREIAQWLEALAASHSRSGSQLSVNFRSRNPTPFSLAPGKHMALIYTCKQDSHTQLKKLFINKKKICSQKHHMGFFPLKFIKYGHEQRIKMLLIFTALRKL